MCVIEMYCIINYLGEIIFNVLLYFTSQVSGTAKISILQEKCC